MQEGSASQSSIPISLTFLWVLFLQQLCFGMAALFNVCMHAQSCLILCNPMDCSPPGSSVHGIFLARILKWIAVSYSKLIFNRLPLPQHTCFKGISSALGWLLWELKAPWQCFHISITVTSQLSSQRNPTENANILPSSPHLRNSSFSLVLESSFRCPHSSLPRAPQTFAPFPSITNKAFPQSCLSHVTATSSPWKLIFVFLLFHTHCLPMSNIGHKHSR